ncbi:MAG TPA: hypothetical protein DCF63_04620 [Planctomycetaceae bacterium]|nr:hypothetical protein [Planctomycetaceae bacterium]
MRFIPFVWSFASASALGTFFIWHRGQIGNAAIGQPSVLRRPTLGLDRTNLLRHDKHFMRKA